VPAKKFYWDAEVHISTQMAVQRWYEMDGYTIIADVYNWETEALGAKFIYSDNAMPTPDVSHPLISSPADLAKLKPLDPSKGRVPFAAELAKLTSERAAGLLKDGFFCSPFSMMCNMMGYPAAVRAMRKNPQFAKDVYTFMEEGAIMPFVTAQAKGGLKSFTGPDAWACFPNLSHAMIREWEVPSAQRLKAKGKALGWEIKAGSVAGDYCEEDPSKFDKKLMWDSFDVINEFGLLGIKMVLGAMGRTQEWDPHWVKEYSDMHGKQPIFMGLNGRFTRDSKPEEIVAKVRQWIDVMGRDGKLMLNIANIPADTSSLNVFVASRAVHTLGRYPIAADLNKVEVKLPAFQPFDEWLKGQPEEEVIRKAREK
jgi:uroporphyrinogen-III decarboxylase